MTDEAWARDAVRTVIEEAMRTWRKQLALELIWLKNARARLGVA